MTNFGVNLLELVLDPELRIVDPHFHLPCSSTGGHADDLALDFASGHKIVGAVHIEIRREDYRTDGPKHLKPAGETQALAKLLTGRPSDFFKQAYIGLVGFADLSVGPELTEELLAAHEDAGGDRFKGVRIDAFVHFDPADHYRMNCRPGWREVTSNRTFVDAVRVVGDRGYSLDLICASNQLNAVAELARQCPQTSIVIDHLAPPTAKASVSSQDSSPPWQWCEAIRQTAACPNIYLKIGGCLNPLVGVGLPGMERAVGLAEPLSSSQVAEAYRPIAMAAIEALGPDRCMFESNFPVDKSVVSYRVLWNAFKIIAKPFSATERQSLFEKTATQVYRLPVIA